MPLPPTWSAHLLRPDHHRAGQQLDSHLTGPDDAGPHAWTALKRITDHERRHGVTHTSRQARAMLARNLHLAWHEGGHLAAARLLARTWDARLYLHGPDEPGLPVTPTADLLLSKPLSGVVTAPPAVPADLTPSDAALRSVVHSHAITLAAKFSPCPLTPTLNAYLSTDDEALLTRHPPLLRGPLLREALVALSRAAGAGTWPEACNQAARDLLRDGQVLGSNPDT